MLKKLLAVKLSGSWRRGFTGIAEIIRKQALLAAAFMAIFAAPLFSAAVAQPPLKTGDPVPVCTLKGLDGIDVQLPDAGKGRPFIVHFWSSSCKTCLKEMPVLESLYERYKEEDLVIYAVHVKQSARTAKAFAERVKISFPVMLDSDGKICKEFGVVGVPRTFFIDRKGKIRTKLIGDAPAEDLDRFIKQIL